MVIPNEKYDEFVLNMAHVGIVKDYLLHEVKDDETKDDVIGNVLFLLGCDRCSRTDREVVLK